MRLRFIHAHSGERMSSLPVIRCWRFVTILVVGLVGLLSWRPGSWVYHAGIWGSGIIVLIYVLTRLIPLPSASGPEEVDLLGAQVWDLFLYRRCLRSCICVNRGCLSSKNLIEAAWLIYEAAHPRYSGLSPVRMPFNHEGAQLPDQAPGPARGRGRKRSVCYAHR